MANLHNLVPVREECVQTDDRVDPDLGLRFIETYNQARQAYDTVKSRSGVSDKFDLSEDLTDDIREIVEEQIEKHDYLPQVEEILRKVGGLEFDEGGVLSSTDRMRTPILHEDDPNSSYRGSTLSEGERKKNTAAVEFSEKWYDTPRTTTEDIKEIAEKLGFIIIPVGYLSKEWYPDVDATKSAFERFCELSDRPVYVVCPASAYSLSRHAKHDDPHKDTFYSSEVTDVFRVVNIQLPTFRTILKRLDSLEENQIEISEAIEGVKEDVEMLREELEDVHNRVEKVRKEAIRAAQENAQKLEDLERKMNTSLSHLADRVRSAQQDARKALSICMQDPMAFAASSLDDGETAVIGPCWGPDFDDIVAYASGFERIQRQQRDRIENAIDRYV